MRMLIAILLLLLTIPVACPALAADFAGTWKGGIEIPSGADLSIQITLQPEDEAWSGTIDIPTQGLKGFALSNVGVQEGTIRFEMAGIPGEPTFEGSLSESGDVLSGTFQQGGASLPFSLDRVTAEEAAAEPKSFLPDRPVPGEGVVGEWAGALGAGPMTLRLALHVVEGKGGALSAVLDSLDQGAKIPVESTTFEDGTLRLSIPQVRGSYEGKMNGDGSAIEGTWTQGRTLPLTFHRQAEAFALNRPQEPQPPFPYDSRDVTFENQRAGLTLAGTLNTPRGEGPFPAVVFITGSGPQDRDESLMGHKPFLVIADHLARRGIASLRYDDRGVGDSEGDHLGSTVADFTADAEAAVAFLAAQPKIDQGRLGIVGHSEGGLTGPRVAVNTPEIDFLVLLAPPGERLDKLLARQSKDALRLNGVEETLIERAMKTHLDDLSLVRDASLDAGALRKALRARSDEQIKQFTEAELARLGYNEAALEQGLRTLSTPWFRSLMKEDPAVHLRSLQIPVLALFGEKDFQVAAEVNAEIIEASLKAAGNKDFEVHILPELNHLFQHAETGALAEYGEIEETFAPQALKMLGAWILARRGASEAVAAN